MSSLVILWLASLIFAALALAIMGGLILARWIAARRGRSGEAERQRLIPLLLRGAPADVASIARTHSPDLLANLAVELIQTVRGADRADFVATATTLGVPALLRRRLDTGSPRIRLAAAEALAEFDDPASVARLCRTLEDPNGDVRLAAGIALASVGRAPPLPDLIAKLCIGRGAPSLLVVGLLRDIAAERPEEIRRLIADPATSQAVRMAAIDAVSASADYTLVPVIADLLLRADPDSAEVPRYLRALGDFAHPAGGGAVRHMLESPSPSAREAAAEAAGRIGLADTAGRLSDLLGDNRWGVRFRAGEALSRLGHAGTAHLSAAALGGPVLARAAARLTLAERGLE